jgi:hypothetical protein
VDRSADLLEGRFQHAGHTPAVARAPVRVIRTRMKARPSSTAFFLTLTKLFTTLNLLTVIHENKAPDAAHHPTARGRLIT